MTNFKERVLDQREKKFSSKSNNMKKSYVLTNEVKGDQESGKEKKKRKKEKDSGRKQCGAQLPPMKT